MPISKNFSAQSALLQFAWAIPASHWRLAFEERLLTFAPVTAMRYIHLFMKSEEGTTSVEYAVLIALILLTTMVGIRQLTNGASGMWANNNVQLEAVGFNSPAP